MSNVALTAQEIKKRTSTINYLVLSQGITTFKEDRTTEGLDKLMALTFYSRWKVYLFRLRIAYLIISYPQFVDELMPCLENAASEGQDVRVMSMFAPAKGVPLDTSDLGLKSSYTSLRSRSQMATYTNLMVAVRDLTFCLLSAETFLKGIRPEAPDNELYAHYAWVCRD